jgi:broad specificity phosphatase PhoE
MVRHGQASFGGETYDKLSPRGHEQARILAEYFLASGLTFDALYSGDIDRQRATTRQIADVYASQGVALPEHTIDPRFNEYDSEAIVQALIYDVVAENPALADDISRIYTDRKAFQRVFEKVMMRWVTGQFADPGFETWPQVQARVAAALEDIMQAHGRNRRILVVASGGTISAAVQYALHMPDEETMLLCWQVVNSSVTRFMYNDKSITLQAFNAFGHLEQKGIRDLITYR